MSSRLQRIIRLVVIFGSLLFMTGCMWIIAIVQPDTAEVGEDITVTVTAEMDESCCPDGGPSPGLLAVLIPLDWDVDEVTYDGDYGPADMVMLDPGEMDSTPGAGVDYWHDSLDFHYGTPEGMQWVVFEGEEFHTWIGDTTQTTATIEMEVGAEGVYDIGYFVTTSDLSWEEAEWVDVSLGNTITVGSPTIILETELPGIADAFELDQNYPNPFNPSTTIRYSVSERSSVKLAVYDIEGQEVDVLVQGVRTAGSYEVNFDAQDLPSGVYMYRMTAGDFVQTHKMTLLR